MTLEEFYNSVYRLSQIPRYATINRIRSEDVAQHSFFVSIIVIKLYDEYEFDLGKALLSAIVHNIPEGDISDIPHSIKVKYPKISAALKEAELDAISKYPSIVIDGFMRYEAMDSIEGLIANFADILQVHQYVVSEISLGNTNLIAILADVKQRIQNFRELLYEYKRSV